MPTVDDFLKALGTDVVSTGDLAARVSASQAQLDGLAEEAGDRLCRLDQARVTFYARTRSLPEVGSRVPITRITETGHPEHIGDMHLLAGRRHWSAPTSELFEGLPPFGVEMSPQGFLGRTFSARHPDLPLPRRLEDWTEDHHILALARRGEDCVGDLVVGRESLDRWLGRVVLDVTPDDFARSARDPGAQESCSSVGGEYPKFAVFSGGRHVIVKYAAPPDTPADQRWHDLLVCEHLSLKALSDAGFQTPRSRWMDLERFRFLEMERFDRVGERGRRGVLSLAAIDNEYYGLGSKWSDLSRAMLKDERLSAADAQAVRWLDVFGQLIANTDRHLGNLSVFSDTTGVFKLAPVYDMLPMLYAPFNTQLAERPFEPQAPDSLSLDVWHDAATAASRYWRTLADSSDLSDVMRRIAETCGAKLEQARERFAFVKGSARR